jgi:D-sedoheptulose 7-phosphate isomerase
VLVAGNGGSAADAQHFAAELVARFLFERPALDAIALTTNTSVLTAIGNDYSFEDIFSRQIYANGNRGDIFVGISTSGNSPDILKAISAAREKGLKIAALIGGKPSKIDDMADYVIKVPSTVTPHVQEMHITIIHLLCLIIEKTLFSRQKD